MKRFHETDTGIGPLRRAEAAEYLRDRYGLRVAGTSLAKYAQLGTGPIYRLAGRSAVYEIVDLDEWAEARLSPPVRSTSELRASV